MRPERKKIITGLFIEKEKAVDEAVRRGVRQALLAHKRAGRDVATWRDGKVVVVPAAQIHIAESASEKRK